MCESYREERPLLYDDLSEEEHYSPQYQRRFRSALYRGRARINAKGAIEILKYWPEHWTTSITYWWIALGMIAITTLIIYNSVVAFAMFPSSRYKATKFRSPIEKVENLPENTKPLSDVFMHIHVDNYEEVDLNKYLPYIKIITNKYFNFKYHLVIVHNDTSIDNNDSSPDDNNALALNSLWSSTKSYHKDKSIIDNIHIEHIMLTEYLEESPVKKYWRYLPNQFLEFLVKAISIWDKGGISFNPEILTPNSPHPAYKEKLQNIFQKYIHGGNKIDSRVNKKVNRNRSYAKTKKRVNNIRDIIDALENEGDYSTSAQQSLTEAENNNNLVITRSVRGIIDNNASKIEITNKLSTNSTITPVRIYSNKLSSKENVTEKMKSKLSVSKQLKNDKTNETKLLPLFLKYLFHNNSQDNDTNVLRFDKISNTNPEKTVSVESDRTEVNKSSTSDKFINIKTIKHVPVIIATESFKDNDITPETISENEGNNQLTIDLKGNILATKTPCHAFIGTVFSNAIHHTEKESLTDFIITELSSFCKGLLSSCNGIDVILL